MNDERLGRCYELAGRFVMDHPDTELVHGTIQRDPLPANPHAWVITPSGIWEPITDETWEDGLFEVFFNAIPITTYTRLEALDMMVEHEHFGPWKGTPS